MILWTDPYNNKNQRFSNTVKPLYNQKYPVLCTRNIIMKEQCNVVKIERLHCKIHVHVSFITMIIMSFDKIVLKWKGSKPFRPAVVPHMSMTQYLCWTKWFSTAWWKTSILLDDNFNIKPEYWPARKKVLIMAYNMAYNWCQVVSVISSQFDKAKMPNNY